MKIKSKQKGLNLIEILIVLIIIAILATLLTPVLNNYIIKSNRSDAIKSLSALQIAQEKWRLNSTSYGTLAQVWSGSSSLGGYYTMAVTSNSATGYTLTATANASQPDSACPVFTVTYSNGTTTNSPASCWQ